MKLLLDEHFSPLLARVLGERGHDVAAAVEDPDLRGLPDHVLLERAVTPGRALVTNDVGDFVLLAHEWRAAGRDHAGIVLTSDWRFPRTHAAGGELIGALAELLDARVSLGAEVRWL